MVLNSAARLVTLTPKANHITPILRKLHWLPVSARIDYKILIMVYKCLNGTAPKYLRAMLQVYSPTRTLRSKSKNLLIEPSFNQVTYGSRAFSVAAPRLWNKLPFHIRQCES